MTMQTAERSEVEALPYLLFAVWAPPACGGEAATGQLNWLSRTAVGRLLLR